MERNFSEEFMEESFIKVFGYIFTGYLIMFGIYSFVFLQQLKKYVVFDRVFIVDKLVMKENILINVLPFDKMSDPTEIGLVLIMQFQLGVIVFILLSLAAWIIALIIRAKVYRNMTAGMCYTVGIYSMTLPNILLCILYFTNNLFPAFILIYLIILTVYAYKFIAD